MQFSSGLKHELYRHWPAGTLEFAYCRTTKPDTSLSCGESSILSTALHCLYTVSIISTELFAAGLLSIMPLLPRQQNQTRGSIETYPDWFYFTNCRADDTRRLSNVFIHITFSLIFPSTSYYILIPLLIISLMLSILWSSGKGKWNGRVEEVT